MDIAIPFDKITAIELIKPTTWESGRIALIVEGFAGFGIVSGDNSTFVSANECNNWLKRQYESGTPVTVMYVLAIPIETPLSEEELAAYANLHTYKDNTTVSNDAGAWMDLEYVMDAKKYIDSLVAGGIAPARVE